MQAPTGVTQMLLRWGDGDRDAFDRLLPLVYEQLKRLAHTRLRQERGDHTLNTTALVHEAYLKLIDVNEVQCKDRTHFYALASRVMRHLLVDYARRRKALKHGGGRQRVNLDEERLLPDGDVDHLLELDEALTRLEGAHPRSAKALEQAYFGGLTNEETAIALGISRATVERDLRFARTWLACILGREAQAC